MEFIRGNTEDGLNLLGVHWSAEKKDTCIVCIHGMAGNIIENYFAQIVGERLSENGYGFLFGHNRGYNHINDIQKGNETKRIGVTFERFHECIYDITLWINKAKEIGYQNIILMGHSLGCNKVIHYISNGKEENITGIILASPPDMVGLVKLVRYQPNYDAVLEEARKNVQKGEPRKILSTLIWDYNYISAQTFLDLFEDHCPADNLPLLRNPENYEELQKIKVPTLAFMGENDDIEIRKLSDDLELIKSKATGCQNFTTKILEGANHVYKNREEELAEMLLDWLQRKGSENEK